MYSVSDQQGKHDSKSYVRGPPEYTEYHTKGLVAGCSSENGQLALANL